MINFTRNVRMPQAVQLKVATPESIEEGANTVARMALNYFSVLNELAMQEFLKCYNALVTMPYFKQELKRDTNACKKELSRLLTAAEVWIQSGEKDAYFSYVDNCDGELRNNIETLRNELLKFFVRRGVIENIMWANIEVAYIVLKEASTAFKEIVDFESKKAGGNMRRVVWDLNPERAFSLMQKVRHAVHNNQPDIFIDGNESRMSVRAYKELRTKLINYKFTVRAMNKTKREMNDNTPE